MIASDRNASACHSARCRCAGCWRQASTRRKRGSTRCCGMVFRRGWPARPSSPSAAAGAPSPGCIWPRAGRRCRRCTAIPFRPAKRATSRNPILKLSPAKIAALPGLPRRRAGSLPAAALVLDRVLKRLRPERVVFSMLGVREGWLYSQLSRCRTIPRPPGRGRAVLRPAVRPRAGLRAGADAMDGRPVRERDRRRAAAARRRLCPVRLCLARRSRPAGGGKLSTPAAVSADRAGPCRARVSRRRHSRALWRQCR